MDQYLYPYYQKDIEKGIISKQEALEILECLWLKFNQIAYVSQEQFLFNTTLMENIRMGRLEMCIRDRSL